ncbi:MAG: hypothetical protein A2064_04915 [Spirochaetes bacterium GWB1_66_5]|nr:MAG: hypothetical protein A2064_04915 [Spirochaetes bacterium GWB1_66_5]
MMASRASASRVFLLRPPEYSSPLPIRMKLSRRSARAISSRLSSLTTKDLTLAISPSVRSCSTPSRYSLTTSPSTESPKNSSFSLLSTAPPCSLA